MLKILDRILPRSKLFFFIPSSVAFKAHMKSHQLFHMCTFCERIFTAKTKLRDHLAIDHRFDCRYVCIFWKFCLHFCQLFVYFFVVFSAHDDIFICPMCEKKHSSSNDLNDHLHFDHHLLKEHLCTQVGTYICFQLFVYKINQLFVYIF